jgi:hypothetical protein
MPITQSGIDPATFRLVVQCLNHCATACPTLWVEHSNSRLFLALSYSFTLQGKGKFICPKDFATMELM